MFLPILGSLISAGTSLLGGSMASDAQADANAANLAFANEQFQWQQKLAKHGIRMRVRDARQSGIHPLYALGAQPMSFAPTSLGQQAETGMAQGLAAAGQDISRAMHATATGQERADAFTRAIQGLQLQKFGLENELLASQIAKLKQTINPAFPSAVPPGVAFPVPESVKPDSNPAMMIGGSRWTASPSTSPMKTFEDAYGDDGPAQWFFQMMKAGNDLESNFGSMSTWPRQIASAAWDAIRRDLAREYYNAQRYFGYERR